MPAGDRTGPLGQGPMSGRALGYCAGAPGPGYANPAPGFGRGFGRGFGFRGGRGRGFRWGRGYGRWAGGYYPPYDAPDPQYAAPAPEQEKAALKSRVKDLEASLAAIKQRINEIDAPSEEG